MVCSVRATSSVSRSIATIPEGDIHPHSAYARLMNSQSAASFALITSSPIPDERMSLNPHSTLSSVPPSHPPSFITSVSPFPSSPILFQTSVPSGSLTINLCSAVPVTE